ncbi:MAG: AI-2E family transporter [Candidatus Peregrinibacteria bacterium]|nr:AI-2E family transporter [Candidatus Peregrinibacteria bacterium]
MEKPTHSKLDKNPLHISDVAPQKSIIIEKLPGYFLLFCLIFSAVLFFQILEPFLTVIFIGVVLSIAFYPLYKKVLKLFRGWEGTASFVTCLVVILLTVVPLTIFVILMAGEAASTYQAIQLKVNSGVFDKFLQWQHGGVFYDLNEKVKTVVDLQKIDIKKTVLDMAQSLSTYLVAQVATLISSISNFFVNVFILLFSMYYFFKDGKKIVEKIKAASPLPSLYETDLFDKIAVMSKAILVGVFLTAILQGFVGGIGFMFAGISNPIFWGTAMAFFSLVPLFGTAIIWVPAGIILAIMGQYGPAIFILIWGALVIGLVDNFARPYLIGGKANTYPLLTFFVIMGGIWTMGLQGVIIGPLVLMFLMSFFQIYEAEYGKVLKH